MPELTAEQADVKMSERPLLRLLSLWFVVCGVVLASMIVAFMLRPLDDHSTEINKMPLGEQTGSTASKGMETSPSEPARLHRERLENRKPNTSEPSTTAVPRPLILEAGISNAHLSGAIVHTQTALMAARQNRANSEVVSHLLQARRIVRQIGRFESIETALAQAIRRIESTEFSVRVEILRRLDHMSEDLSRYTSSSFQDVVPMRDEPSDMGDQPAGLWTDLKNSLGKIYRFSRVEEIQENTATKVEMLSRLRLLNAINHMKLSVMSTDQPGFDDHALKAIEIARRIVPHSEESSYVAELESMVEVDLRSDIESIEQSLRLLDAVHLTPLSETGQGS